jgi:hypothetical protein
VSPGQKLKAQPNPVSTTKNGHNSRSRMLPAEEREFKNFTPLIDERPMSNKIRVWAGRNPCISKQGGRHVRFRPRLRLSQGLGARLHVHASGGPQWLGVSITRILEERWAHPLALPLRGASITQEIAP